MKCPSRALLTAVRQGAAEDSLWQQASRGSTCGTVHEAILTVAAKKNHSPALQEQHHLLSPYPHLPLTLWAPSPVTRLKHSLLRPPVTTVLLNPMQLLSVLFLLDSFQCYSSLLSMPFFYKIFFLISPGFSPSCWLLLLGLSILTLICWGHPSISVPHTVCHPHPSFHSRDDSHIHISSSDLTFETQNPYTQMPVR